MIAPPTVYVADSVTEYELTTTTVETVATAARSAPGRASIWGSFRVANSLTAVTVQVTWTDAAGNIQSRVLTNGLSFGVGDWELPEVAITAMAGAPIVVKYTAGTANNVFASATIVFME